MGRKLYVGNLPFSTSETELQQLFGRIGSVESVNVMRDRATGHPRGFAFVDMATDEQAQNAIHELDQRDPGGPRLTETRRDPRLIVREAVASEAGVAGRLRDALLSKG